MPTFEDSELGTHKGFSKNGSGTMLVIHRSGNRGLEARGGLTSPEAVPVPTVDAGNLALPNTPYTLGIAVQQIGDRKWCETSSIHHSTTGPACGLLHVFLAYLKHRFFAAGTHERAFAQEFGGATSSRATTPEARARMGFRALKKKSNQA